MKREYYHFIFFGLIMLGLERAQYRYIKSKIDAKITEQFDENGEYKDGIEKIIEEQ